MPDGVEAGAKVDIAILQTTLAIALKTCTEDRKEIAFPLALLVLSHISITEFIFIVDKISCRLFEWYLYWRLVHVQ